MKTFRIVVSFALLVAAGVQGCIAVRYHVWIKRLKDETAALQKQDVELDQLRTALSSRTNRLSEEADELEHLPMPYIEACRDAMVKSGFTNV
ncbi:MAG TPA: hypothetical protein VFC07_11635, partial [Verrucomicrobiae bacterium]|nr:hypothetical protein [Verrucomicrobiae bacterium]